MKKIFAFISIICLLVSCSNKPSAGQILENNDDTRTVYLPKGEKFVGTTSHDIVVTKLENEEGAIYKKYYFDKVTYTLKLDVIFIEQ